MTAEKTVPQFNGWQMLMIFIPLLAIAVFGFVIGVRGKKPVLIIASILLFVTTVFLMMGFFTVEPNQGIVLLLFGKYKGTERETGFRWANPLLKRKAAMVSNLLVVLCADKATQPIVNTGSLY